VAIAVCEPLWLQQVKLSYEHDPSVPGLLQKIADKDTTVKDFSVNQGLIRVGGRIWVGQDPAIHHALLRSVHDSVVGGHSGVRATYHHLHRNFAWKGMKQSVVAYVDHCSICKQAKHERVRYPGLLQPLAVPPTMCRGENGTDYFRPTDRPKAYGT
jgi:hypothetical protein